MLNVVIYPVSCHTGMAGMRRVRNFIDCWANIDGVQISNLVILHPLEFSEDGSRGIIDAITYKKLGYKVKQPLTFFKLFSQGIAFLKEQYVLGAKNIFYQYGNPDIISYFLIKYAKHIGFKILLDIVEDNSYLTKDFRTFLGKLNNKLSVHIEKRISNYCDLCITISPYLQRKFMKLGKKNMQVVYMPITINIHKLDSFVIEENRDSIIRIFYGGSFGIKDGIEYLIEAYNEIHLEFSNTELILTGHGSEKDIGRVFSLINKFGTKSSIIYKGYLDYSNYYNTMASSSIMCMTRINSPFANAGFPFKLGEMLATGNPVICTRVGSIDQYLQNLENAVIIEPESVNSLVQTIKFLIKNPKESKRIGCNGRDFAIKHFNAETHSRVLYELLMRL